MVFYQYKDGYRYNSDTIFLYDFISKYKISGSLLDVGSGCGILGLLIKRDFPKVDLTQIDIQEKNASLNKKNALANNQKSEIICDDFLEHTFEKKFDCIISNPPFYHEGSLKSEDESLFLSRHSLALQIDKFINKTYKLLKPKGSFMFCYDAKQIDDLLVILTQAKFKVNEIKFIHVNYEKLASLVMIYAKRESKSLCKVLPPLILYKQREYTDLVKYIYKKADANSENI
ncbi:MAG: methyltransferase [Epsilonproteobacteria bacterium]|nr:methyltransferase [Campylobacterota bacterium]